MANKTVRGKVVDKVLVVEWEETDGAACAEGQFPADFIKQLSGGLLEDVH